MSIVSQLFKHVRSIDSELNDNIDEFIQEDMSSLEQFERALRHQADCVAGLIRGRRYPWAKGVSFR